MFGFKAVIVITVGFSFSNRRAMLQFNESKKENCLLSRSKEILAF